jgi:hypothetical protein
METAVAQPARIVRSQDEVPFALSDVQDLHDADLDGVLNDWLAEGDVDGAAAAAAIVARLVSRSRSAAPHSHDLGAAAAGLLAE